ncbi:unnamed protein product [Lampetra planeri]
MRNSATNHHATTDSKSASAGETDAVIHCGEKSSSQREMGAMLQALCVVITLALFAGASVSQDASLTPSPAPSTAAVVATSDLILGKNSSLALLECRLVPSGNEVVARSWHHNGSEIHGDLVPSNYMNHTVRSLLEAGAYTCLFSSKHNSWNATVLVKAAPQFDAVSGGKKEHKKEHKKDHKKERKLSAYIGHKAVISCHLAFQGFPAPSWTWFKLSADKKTLTLLEDTESKIGARTQHVIAAVSREDEGEYLCVASNDAGSSNDTVTFKVHDLRDAVWPFLGIAAEVVVLIVIIFACEKMGRKKATATPVEDDGTMALKGAAENSHAGTEAVRQRNSK